MVTPEQVGERYLAVHHRMLRAVNDEMLGCGLSMARTKMLRRLHEQGPTRQNVLAADFGLAPHSITDLVDALERLGLAERRPDLRIAGPSFSTASCEKWRPVTQAGCSDFKTRKCRWSFSTAEHAAIQLTDC